MRKIILSSMALLSILISLLTPVFAANDQTTWSLSDEGLGFIKGYERFHSTAYISNNKWYIGYGTPCSESAYHDGIDEQMAETLLREALLPQVNTVNQYLEKYQITVTQHQFDALVSLTYSLGSAWTSPTYRFSSYLIKGLEHYEPAEIIDALGVWCHVKSQVNVAYLERRIEEGRLLLYGDYGDGTAPQFRYLILDPAKGTVTNDTVCYEAGTLYGKLPTATLANFKLEGWYKADGTKLAEDQKVSENLKVVARWTAASPLSFTDVSERDWFYSYVFDLTKSGVIHGITSERFAPQESVTRGQALKLILLAASYGEQKATGSHWASGYLSYAVKQGLLPSSNVNLDEPMNRLEIAQLAAKALKLSTVNITSPFSDTSDPAVLSLYDAGILEGSYEQNVLLFKPKSSITRAEISTIIWRIQKADLPPSPTPEPEPEPEPEPDHSNQFQYNGQWLDILQGVPVNPYQSKLFYQSDGYTLYRSDAYRCLTGVDVSVYQGTIDWNKVKAAGIDFAIIRVGGRGWGSEGKIYADRNFQKNIEGAIDAGVEVGVYFFSQAITKEEAIEEAKYTLEQIKGYPITYPVVFDWERIGGSETRTYGLATQTLCDAANAFCQTVEEAGYKPMIYFNSYCGYVKYDLRQILDYEFWFAQYTKTPSFYYNFHMWQYTSSGQVSGIPGKVDLNLYLIKQ
jgi:GH25 family lysozyme M1 (1,4-beta-N-acetylmuramidase)/GH24 family phage-related lysozyme (muramidase)